jgi:hypothetical protein
MSTVTLSILPTINIDGTAYHNSKDMLTLNPVFFKGTLNCNSNFIKNKCAVCVHLNTNFSRVIMFEDVKRVMQSCH